MENAPDPRLRPEYAQGGLVAVTTVANVAEAEMVRDMLLGEGIPCTVRPAGSFDPRFFTLGTGRHEVLVRESGYEAAYEQVHGEPPPIEAPRARRGPEPGNLLAVVLIAFGLIALLIWLAGNA
jgi:hypothetical protein